MQSYNKLNNPIPNELNLKVMHSRFIASASNIQNAPFELHTEIAILGRSNVGKSTLINLLLNSKNLAKSSSTPGKTKLINFFSSLWEKDGARYDLRFVDFPGFGWAKVSKAIRSNWDRDLDIFIRNRSSIKLFIHLIDSRHVNLDLDSKIRDFLITLNRKDAFILEVFTKADKINRNDYHRLNLLGAPVVSRDDKFSINSLRNKILDYIFKIQ